MASSCRFYLNQLTRKRQEHGLSVGVLDLNQEAGKGSREGLGKALLHTDALWAVI